MSMVIPELWNKSSNFPLQETNLHLKKYKHLINWKENESILEFGFATGQNSSQSLEPYLPKDYKEFIGVDISENMVEYAKKHCKLSRSTIILMDIVGTISAEFCDRFDHIFGFNVIHMVKDPKKAFKNIYKMLKPDGTAFITFFERIPVDDMFDRLTRHPKWSKYNQDEMISTYFYSENPEQDYKKDLEAVGFKNYVFQAEKGFYKFPSVQECYDLVTSVNSTIPRIPKQELEEYLKDYLKELDAGQKYKVTIENGQKCITVNFRYFVVIATK